MIVYDPNKRFGQNLTPPICYGAMHLHNVLVLKEKGKEAEMYGFHIHMTGAMKNIVYERFAVTSDMYEGCEFLGHTATDSLLLEQVCTENLEKQLGGGLKFMGCYEWTMKAINYFLKYGDTDTTKPHSLYSVKIRSHSCSSSSDQFVMGQCDCNTTQ